MLTTNSTDIKAQPSTKAAQFGEWWRLSDAKIENVEATIFLGEHEEIVNAAFKERRT
jgi:hypothetical protein